MNRIGVMVLLFIIMSLCVPAVNAGSYILKNSPEQEYFIQLIRAIDSSKAVLLPMNGLIGSGEEVYASKTPLPEPALLALFAAGLLLMVWLGWIRMKKGGSTIVAKKSWMITGQEQDLADTPG